MNNLIGEKKEETSLIIPQYVNNDINLFRLPFFANKVKGKEIKNILLTIKEKNKVLKWEVLPHQKWGTPSFFDKRVYYAFLSIINEKGLDSPLVPFTFRYILRKMGIAMNGKNIKKIKAAINRIKTTQVFSEGIFYSKEKKTKISDLFSIFDRVILKDDEYECPKTGEDKNAETNFLVLGSWLYHNLKKGYTAPINFDLINKMKPLAVRLYEYLLPNFYPILTGKNKDGFFRKYYSEICKFLATHRYIYECDVKRKFLPHVETLKKEEIISHYRMHKSKDGKDWVFYFYPGPEIFKAEQKQLEPVDVSVKFIPYKEKDSDSINILLKAEINRKVAETLVTEHDIETITGVIREVQDIPETKNPPGLIVSKLNAIKEQREQKRLESQARIKAEEMKKAEEKAREEEEKTLRKKAREYFDSLTESERLTLRKESEKSLQEPLKLWKNHPERKESIIMTEIENDIMKRSLPHPIKCSGEQNKLPQKPKYVRVSQKPKYTRVSPEPKYVRVPKDPKYVRVSREQKE